MTAHRRVFLATTDSGERIAVTDAPPGLPAGHVVRSEDEVISVAFAARLTRISVRQAPDHYAYIVTVGFDVWRNGEPDTLTYSDLFYVSEMQTEKQKRLAVARAIGAAMAIHAANCVDAG